MQKNSFLKLNKKLNSSKQHWSIQIVVTVIALLAGLIGVVIYIVEFFVRREKKEVIHKGKKKMMYPQDLFLEKTLLQLIPNFVTPTHISFLRILMTPFTALLIVNGESFWIPVLVYLFVSFTDLIDGALARTRDMITELGAVIDPIADKVLFIFCALFLLPKFDNQILLTVLIFLELITMVISGLFIKRLSLSGRKFTANIFGKVKMNLQVLGVLFFLIANYRYSENLIVLGEIFLVSSVLFYLLSLGVFLIQLSNMKKKSVENIK